MACLDSAMMAHRILAAMLLWSSAAATAIVSSDFAPDDAAPWMCHLYLIGQDDQWCSSVGFADGFQYRYVGGLGVSPCLPCLCCQRQAHRVTDAAASAPLVGGAAAPSSPFTPFPPVAPAAPVAPVAAVAPVAPVAPALAPALPAIAPAVAPAVAPATAPISSAVVPTFPAEAPATAPSIGAVVPTFPAVVGPISGAEAHAAAAPAQVVAMNVVAPRPTGISASIQATTTTPMPATSTTVSQKSGEYVKHDITIHGLPSPMLLAGSGGHVANDKLTIGHNSGLTLFSEFDTEWEASSIQQLKLLGKMLSFTVDLSNVGCACNLAFYLISMPGRDWTGKPNPGTNRGGQPPFYCDANEVGGQWCPEIDIMEANDHAFQATPHKCDAPSNGHYGNCDRAGCDQNTRDRPEAYGPGAHYTIDTRRPFTVKTEFLEKEGVLSGMMTALSQGNRQIVLDHSSCKAEYLANLSDAMSAGMSLRITYWGDSADTMAWMDSPPCGHQACGDSAGAAVISNITIGALPSAELTEWPTTEAATTATAAPTLAPWAPATTTSVVEEENKVETHDISITGLSSPVLLAGQGGSVHGGALNIKHDSGLTLFSKYKDEWDPANIVQLKLLGKAISFTVDLSRVGCACNLAFYLISSPGLDRDGKADLGTNRGGQPPYYCDANMVGGQWCPEVDIMEANNHAFQTTPHKCDAPSNGHYSKCDRAGCSQNTRDTEAAYGPSEEYTINTLLPFQVQTEFLEDAGVFTGMRTVLRQGGRQVIMDHPSCRAEYLAALSDAMATGMSLRITYWGDSQETMAWMDAPPCGRQSCSGANAGNAVISNISIDRLVWVVSDSEDRLFQHVVPEKIVKDKERFISIGGLGVAKWKKKAHFVAKQAVPAVPALPGLEDCDDAAAESPCKASVKEQAGYMNHVQAKYEATPNDGMTSAPLKSGVSLVWIAASLALLLVGVASFGAVRVRHCGVQRRSKPQTPVLPSAVAGATSVRASAGGGVDRSSVLASHNGSASGAGPLSSSSRAVTSFQRSGSAPTLTRNGSSCQRLLAIVEGTA